jgi:transcriptional regulator with XRE-family HTH domain
MNLDRLYREIGDLIRRRRKLMKLTQQDLAPMLGISRASLANIETGRQRVLVHQLYGLAAKLELKPADLLPQLHDDGPAITPLPLPADLSQKQKLQISQLLAPPRTDREPTEGRNDKKIKR